eukprot:6457599-Amphidinium_carterae.1
MAWRFQFALEGLDHEVHAWECALCVGERRILLSDVGRMYIEKVPEEMRGYAVLLQSMKDKDQTAQLPCGQRVSKNDLVVKALETGSIGD